MGLEAGDFITDLNPNWPLGSDLQSQGDDHARLTKKTVQASFPLVNGPVNCTPADLNLLAGAAVAGSGLALTGFVQMFAGDTAPTGWLFCNGAAIPGGDVDLIALIGANTPDLRGQFVRGWSDNDDVDPDGPRAALDAQAEELLSHQHALDRFESGSAGPSYVQIDNDDSETPSQLDIPTGLTGGDETRPVNVALTFIIKT
jgi:hypothetical protein